MTLPGRARECRCPRPLRAGPKSQRPSLLPQREPARRAFRPRPPRPQWRPLRTLEGAKMQRDRPRLSGGKKDRARRGCLRKRTCWLLGEEGVVAHRQLKHADAKRPNVRCDRVRLSLDALRLWQAGDTTRRRRAGVSQPTALPGAAPHAPAQTAYGKVGDGAHPRAAAGQGRCQLPTDTEIGDLDLCVVSVRRCVRWVMSPCSPGIRACLGNAPGLAR